MDDPPRGCRGTAPLRKPDARSPSIQYFNLESYPLLFSLQRVQTQAHLFPVRTIQELPWFDFTLVKLDELLMLIWWSFSDDPPFKMKELFDKGTILFKLEPSLGPLGSSVAKGAAWKGPAGLLSMTFTHGLRSHWAAKSSFYRISSSIDKIFEQFSHGYPYENIPKC